MADTQQVDVKKSSEVTAKHSATVWDAFRNEFDQLFDRFGRNVTPWAMPPFGSRTVPMVTSWLSTHLPSVDVAESDKAYTITAELPGLSASDVDVSVKNGSLVIKGEKQSEKKTEDKNYHLSERSYGAFERSFYLPEGVDRDKIKAEVAKGVLTVTLPKTETAQAKAKKIEVKAA